MTKKSEIEKSRQEARLKMNYYSKPELSRWTHHVHHKDENPLNNNIDNLEILTIKEHLIKHNQTRYKKIYCPCGRAIKNNQCKCGRTKKQYKRSKP